MTASGRRPTRQQAAVAAYLGETGDFVSAQELHARMRAAGNSIGLATVLVCRTCGRTVEVAGPTVETWAERVAGEHGFRDVRHTVEIVGTCATC